MQASTEHRGAGTATVGTSLPAVACVIAPQKPSAKAKLALLLASTWIRPMAKTACLMGLIGALSWIGSRGGLFGLRVPRPADSADASSQALAAATATQSPLQPAVDAAAIVPESDAEVAAVATTRGILPDGRIVLNQATEEQLQKLPKVGASRARAITELRKRLGRFRSTRDLLRVKGIGPRTLQKIQAVTVVDAPAGMDAGTDS